MGMGVLAQLDSDRDKPVPASGSSHVDRDVISEEEGAVRPFRHRGTDAARVQWPAINRRAMPAEPSDKQRGLGHVSTVQKAKAPDVALRAKLRRRAVRVVQPCAKPDQLELQ